MTDRLTMGKDQYFIFNQSLSNSVNQSINHAIAMSSKDACALGTPPVAVDSTNYFKCLKAVSAMGWNA